MAVLDAVIEENQGLIKELDPNSIGIILDIIQKDIYTKPFESSVRENFSNAFDSIKEKTIALSILRGTSSVDDHFIEDSRLETKDSKFDKDYYNPVHLDEYNNKVTISYVIDEEEKHTIYFKDYGVGLAGERLAGYFRPGYSSKRLSKEMLGKFGAGSKSALSTNIDFYVVESWYNGHYTKVMVYEHYFKCVTPEKGASRVEVIKGRKEIEGKIVDAEEYIYWEKSDRKNGVTLSFNVKVHNKDKFVESVKKQLMYFGDHLTFEIVEDGVSYEPSFKAHILHETDLFIVSRNSYFTVPHILINNVNYNIIDFPELGMNKKYGGIAVKATTHDVDVNAPRESVKWTEKTGNFIRSAIEAASDEAGKILEDRLKSIENPVERYLAANRMGVNNDESELLKQLRNFGGAVRMNIQIDPKGFLEDDVLKRLNVRKGLIPMFNILDMYYKFKTSVITTNTSVVTIAEMKSYSDIDFNKLFYIKHHENTYNIRVSLALYISRKLRDAGTNTDSFQFVAFNDIMEKPMDMMDFLKTTKSKGLVKDPKNVSAYKTYIKGFKNKLIYRELFEAFIIKYGTNVGDVDPEDLKEFIKSISLADDPVLRQKADEKTTGDAHKVHIQTKSVKDSKNEIIAQLKKEKKLLPYRRFSINKRVKNKRLGIANWEEQFWFSMEEAVTADLADIKGTVVYATTEDRDLLKATAYMYLLNKNISSFGGRVLKADGDEDTGFIQISRDNIKFFKQIPGIMDVKEYIKNTHKVEDGALTIKFGSVVNRFITGIYVHKLINLDKVYRIIEDHSILNKVTEIIPEEDIPNILQAAQILDAFPVPLNVGQHSDPVIDIKDNFEKVLKIDSAGVSGLIDSFYSLSQIQELPVDAFEDKEKTLIKSFKSVEIEVFDKEFVDNLEQELVKHREVLELVFIKYMVRNYSTLYDKTRSYEIIDTLINEKLVSL